MLVYQRVMGLYTCDLTSWLETWWMLGNHPRWKPYFRVLKYSSLTQIWLFFLGGVDAVGGPCHSLWGHMGILSTHGDDTLFYCPGASHGSHIPTRKQQIERAFVWKHGSPQLQELSKSSPRQQHGRSSASKPGRNPAFLARPEWTVIKTLVDASVQRVILPGLLAIIITSNGNPYPPTRVKG